MDARRQVAAAVLLLACWLLRFHAMSAGANPRQALQNGIVSVGQNERTFLILTDIHFDPFTGTDPRGVEALASNPVEKWPGILESHAGRDLPAAPATPAVRSDTNYALLVSALGAARDTGTPYDYVLVTGDYLGHDFEKKYRQFMPDSRGYENFVIKTMVFVNRMIQQSFPAVPIVGALGNNDSVAGDYAAPGKPLLEALSKEWKVVAANPDAARDFLQGGYYTVPHPTVPSQEFLVLNTTLWSRLYTGGTSKGTSDAGAQEMDWLISQLDGLRARSHTATLIMHLPPGIDAYASSKSGTCSTPLAFWKKPYLDAFLAAIEGHKESLRDSYAGHTHINDFRVLSDAAGAPYFATNIAPSIAPDHHNPEFEIGVYDTANGALVDYAVLYLKNFEGPALPAKPDWEQAYDFRQLSSFPSYSPANLRTISLLIRSSELVRAKLLDLFATHMSAAISLSAKDWRPYSCAQTEIIPGAFVACSCPSAAQ
jgi:sphingomyelin phosphodiesterase acid-like 3